MGKNRHSKDRLFVTQTEHKYLYGGKKAEIKRAYRRLPYDCCAITLTPFKNPVATREGHVFDLEAVVPFVKEHHINPVTGTPLALKDLVQLRFSRNSDGAYFCPVTYKVFTDNTKIAAVATTGNVFAYDAIDELNIKPKNWTDLLTGAAFKRKDIIVLQDPQDLSSREIENFTHLRLAKQKDDGGDASSTTASDAAKHIRTNAATDRILKELEAKKAKQREVAEKIERGDEDGVSERDKIIATLTHGKPPVSAAAVTGSDNAKLTFSSFTTGEVARSFTSSALAPITQHAAMAATQTEQLDERWRVVRKMKKKGLVRLETTLGNLELQIDCDFVPQTADNFMSLCATKYYDGVLFHRVIKGFMMQGGDPSGTGRGGQSIWGKPFRDEIDPRLGHDERGVLSMANAGPGTNKSQFFITFKATPHLDKKHAVFGRVVRGLDVLDAFEQIETGGEDRPLREIKIIKADVLVNPFQEYEDALAQGTDVFTVEKAKKMEAERVKGTVLKVGDQWVAYDAEGLDLPKFQPQQNGGVADDSVGKYLKPAASGKKRPPPEAEAAQTNAAVAVPTAIDSKKSKQAKRAAGGFGNFSGW